MLPLVIYRVSGQLICYILLDPSFADSLLCFLLLLEEQQRPHQGLATQSLAWLGLSSY